MSDDVELLADPTNPQDAARLAREKLNQGDLDGSERVASACELFDTALIAASSSGTGCLWSCSKNPADSGISWSSM